MPSFKKLSINNLRNITSQSISPGRGINLIYGDNGSGKTSILEAIHLLGLARSFRSAQLKPIVQAGAEECAVFAELDNRLTLGVSKGIRGGGQIHIAGKKADNTAQLAHSLPIQLINSDTFKILEGSPRVRRKYMDWGVFH
ncbi:MAG: AAA family ATPase, partial [Pseudohongiellaceae bacterium]